MMSVKTYFCTKMPYEIKIRNKMAILILLLQFPFHNNFSVFMLSCKFSVTNAIFSNLHQKTAYLYANFLTNTLFLLMLISVFSVCDINSLDQWSMSYRSGVCFTFVSGFFAAFSAAFSCPSLILPRMDVFSFGSFTASFSVCCAFSSTPSIAISFACW